MASLVARTAHTARSPSTALVGIWRSAGGASSSSVLLSRHNSGEARDGRFQSITGASVAAYRLPDTSLSVEFPPAVPKIGKFERDGLLNRNAYPLRNWGGFRVYQTQHRLPSAYATSEVITTVKPGLCVDTYMCVEILKRCSKQKDPIAARQLHECIIQSGLDQNPYVMNTLLNVYIKCGRLQDARQVFDKLYKKDAVTMRIMIGGYADNNHSEDAMEVFRLMRQGGGQPNDIMCLSILKACAAPLALKWGKELHASIRHSDLETNVRVGTALVQMYARCGCIAEAGQVFENLVNRDVIAWNVMIGAYAESGLGMEAYRLFLQMKSQGFTPDAITYMNILNASSRVAALEWVKEVHGHARRAGLDSDLRVGNALLHMYGKSGSVADARPVFDRIEKRDVITWNTMIGAYAESGCGVEAYHLFLEMKQEGFIPDAITYVSVLNGSASEGALEWVKEVHGHAQRAGLELDLRVGNALVHMYGKIGSIDAAQQVFDNMKKRDVATWNIMIGALAESGYGVQAYEHFLQMKEDGIIPDAITYVSILNASASAGALEWVKQVHEHARKEGLETDMRVANALVHMYAKSGSVDDARVVFDRMERRDVISWSLIIGAYAESGCGVEAYRLFLEMQRDGFKPDSITYVNILNSSASAGALEWVRDVHRHAVRARLGSDLRVGNALVHMYAKSGSIEDARLVFDRMETRDVVTWNTMIGGLAQHGCGHEALELFRKMRADGVKPNEISFLAVLSACCHAGLLNEGRRVFLCMTKDFGIEPTVMHYTCMVDLLGRAGRLEEAKLFISEMPVEPNAVTWKVLLGACRTYGNVELGELSATEVFRLEPADASSYVLLSNIYAAAGMWEMVSSVRSMMRERGVPKEAGRSWIEVDDKIHEFVAGDTSHPESEAIYTELNRLTEKLKVEGYIPDTQLVLRNMDEEDKELALCSHSEKLAIVYGLMRSPFEKPIRIFKNLRVCSDCHIATRFISKVTGREIIARDASRFHHFRDGVCSCGDYW